MKGKDLIKNIKNAAFLRERVNYENFKLLEIFYIFPTEERKGYKKGGEMNWFYIWVKNSDWKPYLIIIKSVGGHLIPLKRKGLKQKKKSFHGHGSGRGFSPAERLLSAQNYWCSNIQFLWFYFSAFLTQLRNYN